MAGNSLKATLIGVSELHQEYKFGLKNFTKISGMIGLPRAARHGESLFID